MVGNDLQIARLAWFADQDSAPGHLACAAASRECSGVSEKNHLEQYMEKLTRAPSARNFALSIVSDENLADAVDEIRCLKALEVRAREKVVRGDVQVRGARARFLCAMREVYCRDAACMRV